MIQIPKDSELKKIGGHLGHLREFLHPSFKPYVELIKNKMVYIDLKKTRELLKQAVDFLKKQKRESIVWVGTKPIAKDFIKQIGEGLGQAYVAEKWLGGMLTNFETLKKNLKNLQALKDQEETREFKEMTKKEKRIIQQKRARLEKVLAGLKELKELPQVLIIVDPHFEHVAISEARKKNIKIIGICDVTTNLWQIDYPIPLNDESRLALEKILTLLARVFKKNFCFKETKNKTKK